MSASKWNTRKWVMEARNNQANSDEARNNQANSAGKQGKKWVPNWKFNGPTTYTFKVKKSANSSIGENRQEIQEYQEELQNRFRLVTAPQEAKKVYRLRVSKFARIAERGHAKHEDMLTEISENLAKNLRDITTPNNKEATLLLEKLQVLFILLALSSDWKAKHIITKFAAEARKVNEEFYKKHFSKSALKDIYENKKELIDAIAKGDRVQQGGGHLTTRSVLLGVVSLTGGAYLASVGSGMIDPLQSRINIFGNFFDSTAPVGLEGVPSAYAASGVLKPLGDVKEMSAAKELNERHAEAVDHFQQAFTAKTNNRVDLLTELTNLHAQVNAPHSVEGGLLGDVCPMFRETKERQANMRRLTDLQRHKEDAETRKEINTARSKNWLWDKPSADEIKELAQMPSKISEYTTEIKNLETKLASIPVSCGSSEFFFGGVGRQTGQVLAGALADAAQQGVLAAPYTTYQSGIFPAIAEYSEGITETLRGTVNLIEGAVKDVEAELKDTRADIVREERNVKDLQDRIDAATRERSGKEQDLLKAQLRLPGEKAVQGQKQKNVADSTSWGKSPHQAALDAAKEKVAVTEESIKTLTAEIALIDATLNGHGDTHGLNDLIKEPAGKLAALKGTEASQEARLEGKNGELAQAKASEKAASNALASFTKFTNALPAPGSGNALPLALPAGANDFELVVVNNNGNARAVNAFLPSASDRRPRVKAGTFGANQARAALIPKGTKPHTGKIGLQDVTVPTGVALGGTPEQAARDLFILAHTDQLRQGVLSLVDTNTNLNWNDLVEQVDSVILTNPASENLAGLLRAPSSFNGGKPPTISHVTKFIRGYALQAAAERYYSNTRAAVEVISAAQEDVAAEGARVARDQMVSDITKIYNTNYPQTFDNDTQRETHIEAVRLDVETEVNRAIIELNMVPAVQGYPVVADIVHRQRTQANVPKMTRTQFDGALLRGSTLGNRIMYRITEMILDFVAVGAGFIVAVNAELLNEYIFGRVRRAGEAGEKANAREQKKLNAKAERDEELAKLKHEKEVANLKAMLAAGTGEAAPPPPASRSSSAERRAAGTGLASRSRSSSTNSRRSNNTTAKKSNNTTAKKSNNTTAKKSNNNTTTKKSNNNTTTKKSNNSNNNSNSNNNQRTVSAGNNNSNTNSVNSQRTVPEGGSRKVKRRGSKNTRRR